MKIPIKMLIIGLCLTNLMLAQSINNEISIAGKKPYLIGKIDRSGLESKNYNTWFTKNYKNYTPDTKLTEAISNTLKSYSITVFMGTWCGDSKKEVPRLYNVLDACSFPKNQLTVVALSNQPNSYKQSPQHEERGLNIHRVPTVILYKNGKEVNRIVEHPIENFEKDIENIITINSYKSNYNIVTKIDNLLKTKGTKGLKKEGKRLLKSFEGKVSSMYELNTYGRILSETNRTKEAIAVFKFNTKLFPNNPKTFLSLSNTLSMHGHKKKAIKVLKAALKRHPQNTDLKETLALRKTY